MGQPSHACPISANCLGSVESNLSFSHNSARLLSLWAPRTARRLQRKPRPVFAENLAREPVLLSRTGRRGRRYPDALASLRESPSRFAQSAPSPHQEISCRRRLWLRRKQRRSCARPESRLMPIGDTTNTRVGRLRESSLALSFLHSTRRSGLILAADRDSVRVSREQFTWQIRCAGDVVRRD
jgi:hypothetical protein